MENDEMHLLNAGGGSAGNFQNMFRYILGETGFACESDGHCVLLSRHGKSCQNIFRASAGGEADGDVSRLCQCFHLPPEQRIIAEVVADARDDARIGCECDGRQWAAGGLAEAADKFSGEVGSLGRTTTISESD